MSDHDSSIQGSSGPHKYHEQYYVNENTKKFWKHLLKTATDEEIYKANDGFIKNVGAQMQTVLQWAIDQQKERDKQGPYGEGGG